MEILKEDFEAKLPMLQKAISKCDFISMDTEMSGLSTPQNSHRYPDSLSTRYSKVSASANEFLVVQLGICCFTWSDTLGAYEARPFNFPCFPSNDDEAKSGERFFSSQSSSLEFLLKNHFDFNKWIRHGIPYLTRREEEDYIVRKTEKEKALANSNLNDIPIDDRNRAFIESTIARIKEWLASTDGLDNEELTIPANNAFYRRLVHQMIRTEFKSELDSTSNAHERTMTLRRMTDKIKKEKEDAKIARPPQLNLRRVLDMISEAKKPLIGHNCFLDLMQITQQFLWDLPFELDDWKRALSLEWKTVIDTKHLATHPLIKQHLDNSGLDLVDKTVQRRPFSTVGPKIVMAKDYDRYVIEPVKEIETPSPHVPGTFITGFVCNDNKTSKSSDAPASTSSDTTAAVKSDTPADAGSKAPEVDAASTPAAAADTAPATNPAAAPADPVLSSGYNNAKYHEAGYDAFITGQAYLRFAGYILKERQRMDDEELEHARKKRRVDSSDGLSMEADAASASLGDASEVKDVEKAAETTVTEDKDMEVEDGEVEETPMEKKAILEKRKREIMENPTHDFLNDKELQEYYNKLHVMRSDFPILNLAGPDPEPEDRPYSYMLRNIHSSIQSSTLFHLFEQYNPYTFTWTDDNTAWIQISKFAPAPPGEESERLPYELKPLPLGRLGEEYVNPFYIGDDAKAKQGRDMGVVSEAANIEIITWKQWYDEREARERQQREAARAQRESQGSQHQQFRKNPLKKPYRAPFTPPVSTPTAESPAIFAATSALPNNNNDNKPETVAGSKRKHDGEEEQGRE
ncbi:hypothetical protein BG015_003667 [Linnemannia schmuckeri]|uniref:CAF1-domain-containing protein n=1 Tax=Linnemannia schmuckeri TaxID=64567 RepID=A0A9P5RHP6_9FUNG|nr:hypothetical protein BG015_003667 [Linnemannia schmuckeri]